MSSIARVVWAVTVVLVTFADSSICLSQTKVKRNKSYDETAQKEKLLDSFFPVGDIQEIIVDNYYGRHKLSVKELVFLKQQLKIAKFAGGLLIKPGHITVHIKLNTKSAARSGFVYASRGEIHFDGGTDIRGRKFSGTYYLPSLLNFDNYK